MAISTAAGYIAQLHARGMNNAQIGRALGGYDPAIIGRVASGKRPGSNLAGPLKSLLGGAREAKPAKAEHQRRIFRDEQQRTTNYSTKKPSARRINELLRQAEKQGATRVGVVADVGEFQGYEQRAPGQHLVRSFRRGESGTPGALRSRLEGQDASAALLREIQATTGAEQVGDLRGVTLNFYYG